MTRSQTFAWLKNVLTLKLSQRLPPHPHPGTSAIIFTTGNSKVVNNFRGRCFCFEMVVARITMKLQNVKYHSEPRGQMLVEAARVRLAQHGEVNSRCQCE